MGNTFNSQELSGVCKMTPREILLVIDGIGLMIAYWALIQQRCSKHLILPSISMGVFAWCFVGDFGAWIEHRGLAMLAQDPLRPFILRSTLIVGNTLLAFWKPMYRIFL